LMVYKRGLILRLLRKESGGRVQKSENSRDTSRKTKLSGRTHEGELIDEEDISRRRSSSIKWSQKVDGWT